MTKSTMAKPTTTAPETTRKIRKYDPVETAVAGPTHRVTAHHPMACVRCGRPVRPSSNGYGITHVSGSYGC